MNNLKKINIKNCTYYYFDDIIKMKDFDFDILLNEISYGNILVYNVSYKTLIGVKPLRVRDDQVYEFIRIYDGNRYLVLFRSEKYDPICNRIGYLISQK